MSYKIASSLTLITTFLVMLCLNVPAFAQQSDEVSCRLKAKEVAADTYKGCMTDLRQTQLEQIRRDYKEKLSELKSHYDKELKKMAGGTGTNKDSYKESEKLEIKTKPNKETIEYKKTTKSSSRASGARNMPSSLPAKKGPIKTQVIDLSTPAAPPEEEATESIQSENRLKIEQDGTNDLEIVELPTQE